MATTCVGLATQLFPGHFIPFLHWPHFDQSLGHTGERQATATCAREPVEIGRSAAFNESGPRPRSTRLLLFAPLPLQRPLDDLGSLSLVSL